MASKKKNQHLFKERITRSAYPALISDLEKALGDKEKLRKLLLGLGQPGQPITPDTYKKHGKFHAGDHNYCKRFDSATFTEKRMCRCLYFKKSGHKKECETCKFRLERPYIAADSEYHIEDYEVPAFYYGDGIGEIDLILAGKDGKKYATEVKPPKRIVPDPTAKKGYKVLENTESLLRMVAEIMTYTLGYPEGKYRKAIAFFKGSHQDTEYEKIDPSLKELLTKAEITVFRFDEVKGEKAYKICKL